MQHLLGQTAPVVQDEQEIFQQAGGKLGEGSGVAQVVGLLVLRVQQMIHLRPVMAAVTNPLVLSGDCDQAGASQTTNCHLVLVKQLSLIINILVSYLGVALASLLLTVFSVKAESLNNCIKLRESRGQNILTR